jgi:hypothetical protein
MSLSVIRGLPEFSNTRVTRAILGYSFNKGVISTISVTLQSCIQKNIHLDVTTALIITRTNSHIDYYAIVIALKTTTYIAQLADFTSKYV